MKRKEKKKAKGIKDLKKLKLSGKLSISIGIIVMIIFTAIGSICIKGMSIPLKKSMEREFLKNCEQAGMEVSSLIRVCQVLSSYMVDTLKVAHNSENEIISDNQEENDLHTYLSKVTNTQIEEKRYYVENVILESLWATVNDNDFILGMGMLLEPKTFYDADNYAPYVSENDAKNSTVKNNLYETYSKNESYIKVKETNKIEISDPYDEDGQKKVSIMIPVNVDGEFEGAFIIDIKNGAFSVIDHVDEGYKTIRTSLLNSNYVFVYSGFENEVVGQKFSSVVDSKVYEKLDKNFSMGKSFSEKRVVSDTYVINFYSPVTIGNQTWWVQISLDYSEYYGSITTIITIIVIVCILSLAALILFIYMISKKLIKPIDNLVVAANKIKHGDLDIDLKTDSVDEIGILSKTFNDMAENLKRIIADMSNVLGKLSNGDFCVEVEDESYYEGQYTEILSSLKVIISTLNATLSDIDNSSNQVNSGANQVASLAQTLSQGATEQASAIQELTATMNEITNKIKQNAEKAANANLLSKEAETEVNVSNSKMQEMSIAMQDITNKSNEISKIIKTIDDIAFQTNILALNAAVEAARAGEAGKGFAVVADEVRNLASKSTEAAKQTTVLIQGTVDSIQNGARITDETSSSLKELGTKVEDVMTLITDIAYASDEQSNGVEQITIGIDQIACVVQSNSATAEESAAAAEELSSQSTLMSRLLEKFNLRKK